MKKAIYYFLIFFSIIILQGCKKVDKEANVKNETIIEAEEKTSSASSEHNSVDMPSSLEANLEIPDFLKNYMTYIQSEIYEQPIRIPENKKTEYLEYNNINHVLSIPESSILGFYIDNWGPKPRLSEGNILAIKELFSILKEETFFYKQKTRLPADGEAEQDTEVFAVLLTVDSKFVLFRIKSFKDDYTEIIIEREDGNVIELQSFSGDLHNKLREICGVSHGDIEVLNNATKVEYLSSSGEWKLLNTAETEEFKTIVNGAKKDINYSSGCPFDLQMRITTETGIFDSFYSTDSCGVFIIGDSTYILSQDKRDLMYKLFEEFMH